MYDPSEAPHDRVRRRCMNVVFALIALLNVAHVHWIGAYGREWLSVLFLIVAATPPGIVVKILELHLKMTGAERQRMLRELPAGKQVEFLIYAVLAILVFALNAPRL